MENEIIRYLYMLLRNINGLETEENKETIIHMKDLVLKILETVKESGENERNN